MPKYDWYSDDLANKTVRRDAANSFLSAVLDDPDGLGSNVTGLEPDKQQKARDEFDKILRTVPGGGPLPQKVEVICIEADTNKRANLVVFILHKKGTKIDDPHQQFVTDPLWVGRWVAAWAPY